MKVTQGWSETAESWGQLSDTLCQRIKEVTYIGCEANHRSRLELFFFILSPCPASQSFLFSAGYWIHGSYTWHPLSRQWAPPAATPWDSWHTVGFLLWITLLTTSQMVHTRKVITTVARSLVTVRGGFWKGLKQKLNLVSINRAALRGYPCESMNV